MNSSQFSVMESPLFGNQFWNPALPRYSQSTRSRGIPVQRQAKEPSTPKVVSIPVHFVGSEKARSASAQKIQKVFRGFLIRKSVKKLVAIKREVEEVERQMSRVEMVELIKRDAKERLKVNETLMALLFRLDSIGGADSDVRYCRKALIKRVIWLQERVDAIVSGDETLDMVDGGKKMDQSREESSNSECITGSETFAEADDQTLMGTKDLASSSDDNCANGVDSNSETREDEHKVVDQTLEVQDPSMFVIHSSGAESTPDASNRSVDDKDTTAEAAEKTNASDCAGGFESKGDEEVSASEKILKSAEPALSDEAVEGNVNMDMAEKFSPTTQSLVSEGEGETLEKHKDDDIEVQQPDCIEGQPHGRATAEETENCRENNRDLMERMIEDNQKLMGLMTELFERNEMQCRLLSSLTQRVEELERAFRCGKLRRKKKRQATGTVERPEPTPDARKYGRKL